MLSVPLDDAGLLGVVGDVSVHGTIGDVDVLGAFT